MAKHEPIASKHTGDSPATRQPRGKGAGRQIARLEKELNRLAGQELRRTRRLARTRRRASAVAGRLQKLRAPGEPQARAYCLRDRRTVVVVDPRPVVLANGRHALTGTCEACGARVVTMVSRPISLLTG
jgi:hypothetical protein